MSDFITLGILPGAAGIFGFVLGGPLGGFVGLLIGFLVGLLGLFTSSDNADRIEELEQEVEELQSQLDEEQ